MKKSFSLRDRLRSFGYAFRGIAILLRSEHNAWIHAAATVVVFLAGIYFQLTGWEWCMITFAIIAVWSAEAFNTAIEFLADATTPDHNPLIGKAKDVAAAAVLIAAMGSVIIGLIVFGPHLLPV